MGKMKCSHAEMDSSRSTPAHLDRRRTAVAARAGDVGQECLDGVIVAGAHVCREAPRPCEPAADVRAASSDTVELELAQQRSLPRDARLEGFVGADRKVGWRRGSARCLAILSRERTRGSGSEARVEVERLGDAPDIKEHEFDSENAAAGRRDAHLRASIGGHAMHNT